MMASYWCSVSFKCKYWLRSVRKNRKVLIKTEMIPNLLKSYTSLVCLSPGRTTVFDIDIDGDVS